MLEKITDRLRELPAWIFELPTGKKLVSEFEAAEKARLKAESERRTAAIGELAEARAAAANDDTLRRLTAEHAALAAKSRDPLTGAVRAEFVQPLHAAALAVQRRQEALNAHVRTAEAAVGPDPEVEPIIAAALAKVEAYWAEALALEHGEGALFESTKRIDDRRGVRVGTHCRSYRPVVRLVSELLHGPSNVRGKLGALRGLSDAGEARRRAAEILASLPTLESVPMRRNPATGNLVVDVR